MVKADSGKQKKRRKKGQTAASSSAQEVAASSQELIKRDSVTLADESGEWVHPEGSGEAKPENEGIKPSEPIKEDKYFGDDLYASFVRQATKISRLQDDEERALGLRVRDHGDERAAKKLVLHNLRLGIKMAHQYRRNWTNLMDLVQEASAGMAIAAQKWDPDKGTRYGTYAAYWIRAQLTKFLMTNGRLIHTGNTRAGRKVYFNLPQVRRHLVAKGESPTVERIAEEVGEDPKEVALIISRLQGREASLSTPIDESGGSTLEDTIAGSELDPETNAAHSQMNEVIADLIKGFEATIKNERDLTIWQKHLISSEPVSLVELGKTYGVSKQRMGQLATRLKRGFRRHIIDELGPTTQLSWLFSDR